MTPRDEILAMAREAGAVGFHNCTSSHHELFLMSAEAISELVRLAQAAAYEQAAQLMSMTVQQCIEEDSDPDPFIWASATIRAMKE